MPPVCFTTETDMRLIELVKNTPILYNNKHEDYAETSKRDGAWEKIGRELGKSALSCKTRWVNIRDNLRRKLRERERESSVRKRKRYSKYKYEDELNFLLPFFKGSFNEPSQEIGVEDMCEYDVSIDDDAEMKMPVFIANESSCGSDYLDVKPDISQLHSPDINFSDATATSGIKCRGSVSTSQEKCVDHISVFLGAVDSTLRNLNPYYLNVAKSRIFQVVQECELQQIVNKGDPPSS